MADVDPAKFFDDGRVPCERCGHSKDFGSSEALYYADLSTPCASCGFRFLEHSDRRMRKLMEMADRDPEWRKLLRSGSLEALKQRLDELVPIQHDES